MLLTTTTTPTGCLIVLVCKGDDCVKKLTAYKSADDRKGLANVWHSCWTKEPTWTVKVIVLDLFGEPGSYESFQAHKCLPSYQVDTETHAT